MTEFNGLDSGTKGSGISWADTDRLLQRVDQSLDFRALRCIGGQSNEQLIGFTRRVLFSSQTRESHSQIEPRLIERRVESHGAFEEWEPFARLAAFREHESEIGQYDWVVRFDPVGALQRSNGRIEPARGCLTRGEP